jgi:hypothetical protein
MAIILDHVKIIQALEALGLEFEPVSGVITYGEANDGANVGAGTGHVYKDKTGVTLNFRTLIEDPANPGITITTEGDTIKFGTVAGTGNVVGTPPSVADGVATYDGTTGLLIDGPDTKFKTVSEPLSETPPFNKDAQYMEMRTSEGSDWAEIIRFGISAAGSFDNNTRLGPLVKLQGQHSTLTLSASQDPKVNIIGGALGKLIHEEMQEAWEIKKQGKISQEVGANTPILTLKNGDATTFTEVVIKAGNVLPNGVVDGKNGDRYYFRDTADASNTTAYVFQNLTPGNNSWVEAGGGVTEHSDLTNPGMTTGDDHTQYALLAGRTGGQVLEGGTGSGDSLELKSTAGNAASGSMIKLTTGNDGNIDALNVDYQGNVGVTTTVPGARLEINRSSGKVLQIGDLTNNWGANIAIGLQNGNGFMFSKMSADNNVSANRIGIIQRNDTNGSTFELWNSAIVWHLSAKTESYLRNNTQVSGTQFSVRSTPGSSSTATLFKVEADGTNWSSGARCVEIISDDSDAVPLVVNDGSSDVIELNRNGSIRMEDGFEQIGRVSTCNDSNGTHRWLPPNPVFERTTSSNYTATVLSRTIICYEAITVTLPITGIEDGHIFEIKNALGVNYGSGATGNVTLSISGGSNYFDGSTTVSSLTLADDGWVTKVQWSSSTSGYWVLKHQFVKTTGNPA